MAHEASLASQAAILSVTIFIAMLCNIAPVYGWGVTVLPHDTRSIELEIDVFMPLGEVGVIDGNSTLLFVLSESVDGNLFSPEFQVEDARVFPTGELTIRFAEWRIQTPTGLAFVSGYEFRTVSQASYHGPLKVRMRLTVATSSGFFMRLGSDPYPFDYYTFGLCLVAFFTGDVSPPYLQSSYSESLRPMKDIPFVEKTRGRSQLGNNAVIFVSEEQIRLVRSQLERSVFPLSIVIALALALLVAYVGQSKEKLGDATRVYLSLVVLDLGVLQQSHAIGSAAVIPALTCVAIVGMATASLLLTPIGGHWSLFPMLLLIELILPTPIVRFFELSLAEPFFIVFLAFLVVVAIIYLVHGIRALQVHQKAASIKKAVLKLREPSKNAD
jgi:hypothetical protein